MFENIIRKKCIHTKMVKVKDEGNYQSAINQL